MNTLVIPRIGLPFDHWWVKCFSYYDFSWSKCAENFEMNWNGKLIFDNNSITHYGDTLTSIEFNTEEDMVNFLLRFA